MANPFVGEWQDDDGRRMTIKKLLFSRSLDKHTGFKATYRVSILLPNGDAAVIDALGDKILSSRLPGHIDPQGSGDLLVELGVPGLGTYMHLSPRENVLAPRLRMGLFHDDEDDLGVPWILPLSCYRRLK